MSVVKVPDSAELAEEPSAVRFKSEATYKILPLGQAMEGEGTLESEILPEYVFNAYTDCEDPLNQEGRDRDVQGSPVPVADGRKEEARAANEYIRESEGHLQTQMVSSFHPMGQLER